MISSKAPVTPRPVVSAGDARTLAIKFAGGSRHRDFGSLHEDCEQEDFDDFPLSGPRTVLWCLCFLRRRRVPTDHHAMFKNVARLNADSWGVSEHENLCQMLTLGGEYDQLDLTNCAWSEAALRRLQTIEWVYHEKVREAEVVAGDRITVEEMSAFAGTTRAGEVLMLCPALLAHVKAQVETDVGIMKVVRKAREERELKRTKKQKPGKNNEKE